MAIEYKKIEHWIPLQAKAEKEMLAEFEAGNYTIDNPLIKYNPYLINPLAAVILFKTEEEVAITLSIKGKTKAATFSHTFPKATTHILPIVGLYQNYNNTIEVTPYRGETRTFNIEVGDVAPEIVDYCLSKDILVLPGCITPSEVAQAVKRGLEVIKFFPAEQFGGVATIKALAAPYTNVKFMPTGGVSAKNLADYLGFKKIVACGGSWMVKGDMIAAGEFDKIKEMTAEAVALVKEIRG